MPELVPLDEVRPSAYNPRESDPTRLDLIELSLRKLGFLLPLYADPDGEILSGHQRHLVAARLGVSRVPVERVKRMPLHQRQAVNVLFNRGTNDLGRSDTTARLGVRLAEANVDALAAELPDLEPDTDGFYPCLAAEELPIGPLLEANHDRLDSHAASVARSLARQRIVMPVIAAPDGRVVNGLGRLEYLAATGATTAPVVTVSAGQAAFAEAMLNLLSMDFTIHERYADELRYGSYRRALHVRTNLGAAFTFGVLGVKKPAHLLDLTRPDDRARWLRVHGPRVLDFGAGHLTQGAFLRAAGVRCTDFEPYVVGSVGRRNLGETDDGEGKVDPELSRQVCRSFLADVAAGARWTSIFSSSVLNSVPFHEDRRHVVTLMAAVCDPPCRLFLTARSMTAPAWQNVDGKPMQNGLEANALTFRLEYEPRVTLSDFTSEPKAQKFFAAEEVHDLLAERFRQVECRLEHLLVFAVASDPKPVTKRALKEAIGFEFDLPYADGSRMGLVDEAIQAFKQRGLL